MDDDGADIFGRLAERASCHYLRKICFYEVIEVERLFKNDTCIPSPDFLSKETYGRGYKIITKVAQNRIYVGKEFKFGIEVKAITNDFKNGSDRIRRALNYAEVQLKMAKYKILHLHCYEEKIYERLKIFLISSTKSRVDEIMLFLNGEPKERIVKTTSLQATTQPSTLSLGANRLCLNEQLQQ